MRTVLAVVLVACLVPRAAHAGRDFYGWLYGTEVMPERGVELQTWIYEQNERYGAPTKETWLWWGPVIGVTDQLELSLPVELDWADSDMGHPTFTFKRYGVEARYRFVSQDPVDAPPLVPLLRVAVKRDVTVRDDVRVEGDAVVSYEHGFVHTLIDLGFVGDITPDSRQFELRPGAGISLAVGRELRLGAEVYSEINTDSETASWAVVGPDLSWTHGRFWFSGAFGIGVYHVRVAPRAMWGIAF